MSAKPKRQAQIIRPKQFEAGRPIRRKINLRTPAGKRNTHWVEVTHDDDPKQVIQDSIGTLPADVVQFSRILVAIYKPPLITKSAGGIIFTNAMSEEDVEEYYWQGKVGLVVAMGPQAYVDDESAKFHGTKNKVGDWVWFQPSNGQACEVNETFCRVFDSERFLNGVIPHPDFIW